MKKETVNHPSHYNTGRFEVIEVVEDWQLDFVRGNIIKYAARAGKKEGTSELEDLQKCLSTTPRLKPAAWKAGPVDPQEVGRY